MTDMLPKLHHVGVVVRDLEASTAWYVEHLGFERLYEYAFPGVRANFIRRGDIRIEFFQTEGAAPMARERAQPHSNLKIGGINHFAIEVGDLDRTVAELREKGVEIVSPPREVPNSGGERFGFIHDNQGMLIELFQSA